MGQSAIVTSWPGFPRRGVRGGYWAFFRLELPACYHPNLGIFRGVWLFQKKLRQKNVPYAGQITF